VHLYAVTDEESSVVLLELNPPAAAVVAAGVMEATGSKVLSLQEPLQEEVRQKKE
jgi:hypothetical protein